MVQMSDARCQMSGKWIPAIAGMTVLMFALSASAAEPVVAPKTEAVKPACPVCKCQVVKKPKKKTSSALDANKDGVLTLPEVTARLDKQFKTLDTNGDGQISRDELLARQKAHFARADKDNDGKVTPADWTATAKPPENATVPQKK